MLTAGLLPQDAPNFADLMEHSNWTIASVAAEAVVQCARAGTNTLRRRFSRYKGQQSNSLALGAMESDAAEAAVQAPWSIALPCHIVSLLDYARRA